MAEAQEIYHLLAVSNGYQGQYPDEGLVYSVFCGQKGNVTQFSPLHKLLRATLVAQW